MPFLIAISWKSALVFIKDNWNVVADLVWNDWNKNIAILEMQVFAIVVW